MYPDFEANAAEGEVPPDLLSPCKRSLSFDLLVDDDDDDEDDDDFLGDGGERGTGDDGADSDFDSTIGL